MKSKKSLTFTILALTFVALVAVAATALVKKNEVRTASSYEDADGWIYACTQPVRVKDQGATYGNGTPSPTPIDEAEAQQYCHRVGIE